MTDMETRVEELEEDMEALRRTGEELEYAIEALNRLADVVVPQLPAESLLPLVSGLRNFLAEWEITRHPPDLLIERAVRAWLNQLEMSAGMHDPDGLVKLNRSALHDVIDARRAFDEQLQRAAHGQTWQSADDDERSGNTPDARSGESTPRGGAEDTPPD